jgi:hypothetical protein
MSPRKLRVGAIIALCLVFAPIVAVWAAYGAWLTARDLKAFGHYQA